MGTPDLEATATKRIKLRPAITLALIIATVSFVGSQNISGRLFSTAPVAADAGEGPSQSEGPGAVGGNSTFSLDDFESAIGGRYGGFDVAVIESRGIPENNSGLPIIVVEVAIRNSTDTPLRLPASMFGIETETERVIPIHRFEHTEFSTRLVSEPGMIQTATIVTRMPPLYEADPGLYQLRISEPYRTPLVLPITGQTSDSATADGLAIDVTPAVPDNAVTIIESTSSFSHRAYRSIDEHHLVTVTFNLAVGDAGGSTIDVNEASTTRWWSLVSGDQAFPALTVDMSSRTASTARITVVFEPSTSAQHLSIVGGVSGQSAVRLAEVTVIGKVSETPDPD